MTSNPAQTMLELADKIAAFSPSKGPIVLIAHERRMIEGVLRAAAAATVQGGPSLSPELKGVLAKAKVAVAVKRTQSSDLPAVTVQGAGEPVAICKWCPSRLACQEYGCRNASPSSDRPASPITTEQLDKLQFGRVLHDRPASAPTCERCQGNGEIVTNWDDYLHPKTPDAEEHSTTECPDCDGEGVILPAPASAPVAVTGPIAWLDVRTVGPDWKSLIIATNPQYVENNGPENFAELYVHPAIGTPDDARTYCSPNIGPQPGEIGFKGYTNGPTPDDAREALKRVISEWDKLKEQELQLDDGVELAIADARSTLAAIPHEREAKRLRDAIQDLHRVWFTGADVDKDAVTAACLSLFRLAAISHEQEGGK